MSTTVEPVTTNGWYACHDGTIAEYHWRAGQLVHTRSVATWADVPDRDDEIAQAEQSAAAKAAVA